MPQSESVIIKTEITPEKNGRDIESFIESEVQRLHDSKILLKGQLKRDFRKAIVKKLKAGSNGMFQWVAMSLETIKSCKTSKDLKVTLGSLPQKLSMLYDGIYEEIVVPESYAGKVAIMTFTLLLYAHRLMSSEELLAAVSRHLDEEELASNGWDLGADSSSDSASDSASDLDQDSDSDNRRSSNTDDSSVTMPQLLEICRNLVVFDHRQDAFRFPHLSVREYLLSRIEYTPLRGHVRILTRCIYGFIRPFQGRDGSHQGWVLQEYNEDSWCTFLAKYAFVYWIHHYAEAGGHEALDENIHTQLDKFLFLDDTSKPSRIFTIWCSQVQWTDLHSRSPDSLSLRGRGVWGSVFYTATPSTPIQLACTLGLLSLFGAATGRQGFDANDPSEAGALQEAASHGRFEIVKLLTELGADPDSREPVGGRTSLACAIAKNHEEIARYLLDICNADPNIEDNEGNTSLHLAAAFSSPGNVDIAQRLLGRENVRRDAVNRRGETPLIKAFQSLDCSPTLIAALLDRGVDVNNKDGGGCTALHAAARLPELMDKQLENRVEAVRLLLGQKEIKVNPQDQWGDSPLHKAARIRGIDQIVELLLARKDIQADLKNHEGKTPLMTAAAFGNTSIVRMLLSRDDVDSNARDGKLGMTPLLWASFSHRATVDTVRILLESGKADPTVRGFDGSTAVAGAAVRRDLEALCSLIAQGLDASLADDKGQTPFLLLCSTPRDEFSDHSTSDTEVIKCLLDADELGVMTRDFQGRTALSWAAETSTLDVVKLLVTKGADTSLANHDGIPPLFYASRAGRTDIVEFLLSVDHGCLAARDVRGRTVLSWAAERSTLDVVKLLVAKGVDTSLGDHEGVPPLFYACSSWKNKKVLEYLLSLDGVDLATRDSKGRTVLAWTIESKWATLDTVKLLVSKGADMSIPDNDGRTPLDIARGRKELGQARGQAIMEFGGHSRDIIMDWGKKEWQALIDFLISQAAELQADVYTSGP